MGPTENALRLVVLESRRHLDALLAATRDVDQMAIDVIKINGALLALALTGAGVAVRTDASSSLSFRVALGIAAVALGALVLSMLLCVAALVSYDVVVGLGNVDAVLAMGVSESETLRFAISTHADAIRKNSDAVNSRKRLIDGGIVALVAGVLCIGASAILLIA